MRVGTWHAALTDMDTTAQCALAAIRDEDSRSYRYVKFLGSNTVSAGDVVCFVSGNLALDTVDVASSGIGAGVALAGVTSGGGAVFGFIQIKGPTVVRTTPGGSPAYGDPLMTGSSGQATKATAVASGSVPPRQIGLYLGTGTIESDFPY
jgi:hypothetical protein